MSTPRGSVSEVHLRAAYDDPWSLEALARQCLAVTTEFENVPAASLELLSKWCAVLPSYASPGLE